jgi:hypothetical protein
VALSGVYVSHCCRRCCCCCLCVGLVRYAPPRQNKTGVNLLTTGGNLTTHKVSDACITHRGGGLVSIVSKATELNCT